MHKTAVKLHFYKEYGLTEDLTFIAIPILDKKMLLAIIDGSEG